MSVERNLSIESGNQAVMTEALKEMPPRGGDIIAESPASERLQMN